MMSILLSACSQNVAETTGQMTTDDQKHSVPLEDILSGGPPKDGIPSIDEPEFTSVADAEVFLEDDGIGLAVSFDGVDRFYPFQILVWHEIVNDTIGSQDALITYCPLCGSGIVFDPTVNGETSEFGTSGKLWESNLVMYDRQTDSYWSQILGEAIVGEMTGASLELLPHQNLRWKDWKAAHPNGEVLSRETGFDRNYTSTPYDSYELTENLYFPVSLQNNLYHSKAPVYGIEVDGKFKAYLIENLQGGNFTDTLADVSLNIDFDADTQEIHIQREDTGENIYPVYSFWFSWAAAHHETETYSN